MKRYLVKAIRVTALLLMLSTFWTTSGYGVTPEQILVWVARQMHIEHVHSMPDVHYLSRQALQNAFQDVSRNSFTQWKADYGEAQARVIMNKYLSRVMGFFNPGNASIYVGNYLRPCRQQAVLAHELTHYFQNMVYGPIDPRNYGHEEARLFREMEAYHLEAKFTKLFCDTERGSIDIVALLY